MADKNLHDIKIDELDSPKKTPLKNILTLLALLFIILVISFVITNLILKTDKGQEIEGNSTNLTASTQMDSENNLTETITNSITTPVPVLNPAIPDRNLSSATKDSLRTHTPVKEVKEGKNTPKLKTYKTPKVHTKVPTNSTSHPKHSTSSSKTYIDKVVTKKPAVVKKRVSYLGGHKKQLALVLYT